MQQQMRSMSHAFIVEGVDMVANSIESRTWEEEFCNRMINTALPEPGVKPLTPREIKERQINLEVILWIE